MTYEPHPHALLLPPLTDEEYEALKTDIATHGILYPIILDDEDRILDGVHRVRIADELGIDPPVSVHAGLDDERKLHLAVGLNMRRRHLDADKRRALVRRLSKDEGMSLRQIASVTGWSKSTVDRDLKTSPFEVALSHLGQAFEAVEDEDVSDAVKQYAAHLHDGAKILYGIFDQEWKQGNWPPEDDWEFFQCYIALWHYQHALFGTQPDPEMVEKVEAMFPDEETTREELAKRPEWVAQQRELLSQMGQPK